jgi:3-deoxy-manno-octulosonate cytidylyltransferase (CMP-KDO synthetase)
MWPEESTLDCVAIIPARYAATRFPGKPLAELCGRPLIAHVVERVAATPGLRAVLVATDDQRIADAAVEAGGQAVLTTGDHASGTDRVAAVAATLDADVIVNVQGDEPLINPEELGAALAGFVVSDAPYGTLRAPLRDARDLWDPNAVKLVIDAEGRALYFSRAPLPFPRTVAAGATTDAAGGALLRFDAAPELPGPYWLHVGVYLYRTPALLRWARMPQSPLEQLEGLEQLRVLEAGERMATYEVSESLPGVDTPEDLERVQRELDGLSAQNTKP